MFEHNIGNNKASAQLTYNVHSCNSWTAQMQVLRLQGAPLDCVNHLSSTLRLPHQRSTAAASCSYSLYSKRPESHRQLLPDRSKAYRQHPYAQPGTNAGPRRFASGSIRTQAQQSAGDWDTSGVSKYPLQHSEGLCKYIHSACTLETALDMPCLMITTSTLAILHDQQGVAPTLSRPH